MPFNAQTTFIAAGIMMHGTRWRRQLAVDLGLSPSLVNQIAAGTRHVTPETMKRLHALLVAYKKNLRDQTRAVSLLISEIEKARK
jgi:transcriptional regulator with XRE-family HTH domain